MNQTKPSSSSGRVTPRDELLDQSSKGEEKTQIRKGDSEFVLQLPLGHHTLFLRSGGKTSKPLEVNITAAPVIHLLYPLPRDRVNVGTDIPFYSTIDPGISGYRIDFAGRGLHPERKFKENTFHTRFTGEGDLEWKVFGVDPNGTEIPPPYSNPLYLRYHPFAAPKLKPRPSTAARP